MTLKKHILSLVTKNHSGWVEKNDYDLENYEEIRANTYIVVRIKQYMKENGLRQNELATLLDVTPQYVNKLLHGQVRNIGVGTLLRYSRKLDLKLIDIPGLTNTWQKEKLAEKNIKYKIEIKTTSYQSKYNLGSSLIKYNTENYGYSKCN